MKRFEVCTWDYSTGATVVDHTWSVSHHKGERKMAKLVRRVNRWARKAQQYDKATDHTVYVRAV